MKKVLCPMMGFRRTADPDKAHTSQCAWYDRKNNCCCIFTKCKKKEENKK